MFTRMYNYTKNKHIPSSFLSHLRYWVEREGKIRRTVAVLGTVLRNSKWSDLSVTNINMLQYSFEINHYLFALPVTILLTTWVFFNFNQIYLFSIFNIDYFSSPSDNLTLLVPLFDVLGLLIPASLVYLTTISTNFFFLLTPINWYATKFSNSQTRSAMNTRNFSFWDNLDSETWEVLKKASTKKSNNIELNFQLDQTTASTIDFELEYYLYKSVSLMNIPTRPILNETPILFLCPKAYGILREEDPKPIFKKTLNDEPYLLNVDKRRGSIFYTPTFSYQTLNTFSNELEMLMLNQNLTRQGVTSNSLRWAYRYNNLHRRSILNSHKLTEAKRLLSAGFFDSSSTQNNLWFSDQYARDLTYKKRSSTLKSLEQVRMNWNLLYRSTFGYQNLTNPFKAANQATSTDLFTRLSCYESSFHFFLNRVKFYSSLRNHSIKSVASLSRSGNLLPSGGYASTTNSVESLYYTTMDTIIKDSTNKKDLLRSFDVLDLPESSHNSVKVEAQNASDVIVITKDSDLLVKKTTELLFNVSKSFSLKSSFVQKFNYNSSINNQLNLTFTSNFKTKSNKTLRSNSFRKFY